MTTTTNETFRQLLAEYKLAHDYSFPVELDVAVLNLGAMDDKVDVRVENK